MTKYISEDGKKFDVYQILAVEERDHHTMSLLIDCSMRNNKHVISRDAHSAWKPKYKDHIVFYEDGSIEIVETHKLATLGKPFEDYKPQLGTAELIERKPSSTKVTSGLSSQNGLSTAQSNPPPVEEVKPDPVMTKSNFGRPRIEAQK